MSPKTKERIYLIYGITLSVLILSVGVCFALSCYFIYRSGDSPFTRESIAAHFERIAIPTYLCIAGVLGGAVLSLALPSEAGRVKARRDALVILEDLGARLNAADCDEATLDAIRKERTRRRVISVVAGVLSGVVMLPAFAWCHPSNFSIEHLSADIKTAALVILPCAAVALGVWVVAALLRAASVARQTAVIKAALVTAKGGPIPAEKETTPKKGDMPAASRVLWGVRGLLLIVGILFVLLGMTNGGMADVLGKAIRICTECIGLG